MKKVYGEFRDRANYDAANKTAISVRDGVLEYYGSEIGYQPPGKIFKVYRSPATIANAAHLMRGIAVTNEHVSLDTQPANPQGQVLSSKMVDLSLADVDCRIGVLNTLQIDEPLRPYLDAGKRELSLGYRASLIDAAPGSNYDLEQIEIVPHHLAVVEAGRCGSICSFVDHKRFEEGNEPMKTKAKPLHKAFVDAEGNLSIDETVSVVKALPNAIRSMPVAELNKIMPMLQEIVKAGGGVAAVASLEGVESEEEVVDDDAAKKPVDKNEQPGNNEPTQQPNQDEEGEPVNKPVKKEVPVTDTAEFKDAVAAAAKARVTRHVAIMDKARKFLPETYDFADKSSEQIMRDALETEHGKQAFADSELDVAFKMLKKQPSQHRNFGDGAANGKFAALADKEV